jgi:hypothetical protein
MARGPPMVPLGAPDVGTAPGKPVTTRLTCHTTNHNKCFGFERVSSTYHNTCYHICFESV